VVLNGGIASVEQAASFLDRVDGVMMGRAAYQEPWRLLTVDRLVYRDAARAVSPKSAARAMLPYIERELARGAKLSSITRHMLGLFRGVPGARAYRRHLATQAVKPGAGANVLADALALVTDADLSHIAA
jgi:tRNA-dihydrouridine synthase A